MKILRVNCLFFAILICIGCKKSSQFDIEYEKTQSQLDSNSTLLLNRHIQFNQENLHSYCLFKTIKTNCNFEQEVIFHIGMGLASVSKDSIEASFGLPFGNYSLDIRSNGNSTNLKLKEFHDKSEQILKYELHDELTNSLSIPLEYQIIEFENKKLDSNIYEIWGKLKTKRFIKANIYNENKMYDNCYWELEFLAKINLIKF